ncbi:hypothetical protein SeMB42_g05173 [Synchytrium endobioticum]|uniref:CRAL-TRIO domain-containing protein n=1 Tax=Synchytrium endobioticum TaxID=286115 RepID=A0A507DI33_9FUNG|nr:hypothetical protein SeMB42_g05173 [Synchytrium endobioticum]TPX51206.1 hypothetical protein SeLEV6574_g00423 [Synchytrium endobioticum]
MTNYPELRAEHRAAIQSIQKTVARQVAHWISARNFSRSHVAGLVEIISDDAFVLRHFKFHKFQIPVAEAAILQHLEWRLTHDIPLLSLTSVPSGTRYYLHNGVLQFHGRDTDGRPLMLVNLARLKGGSVEDLRIFALFVFECARRILKSLNDYNDKREVDGGATQREVPFLAQVSIIVDLHDLAMHNMRFEAVPVILDLFQRHIPGMVATLYVLGYSWIYAGAWGIIKAALPAELATKLQFVDKSALAHCIAEMDSVAKHLGSDAVPYAFLEDRFFAEYGTTAELYVKERPHLVRAYEVLIGAVIQEDIVEDVVLAKTDAVVPSESDDDMIEEDDMIGGIVETANIGNGSKGSGHVVPSSSSSSNICRHEGSLDDDTSISPSKPIQATGAAHDLFHHDSTKCDGGMQQKSGVVCISNGDLANGSVKPDEEDTESEDLWYDAPEDEELSPDSRQPMFEKRRSSVVPAGRSASAPPQSSAGTGRTSGRKKSSTTASRALYTLISSSAEINKPPLLSLTTNGNVVTNQATSWLAPSNTKTARRRSSQSSSATPVIQVPSSSAVRDIHPHARSSLVTRPSNNRHLTDDDDWAIISPSANINRGIPRSSSSLSVDHARLDSGGNHNGHIIHLPINTHNAYNRPRRNSMNPIKSAASSDTSSPYDPSPPPPYAKVLGDYGQGSPGSPSKSGSGRMLRKDDESIVSVLSVSALTIFAMWVARRSVLSTLENLIVR